MELLGLVSIEDIPNWVSSPMPKNSSNVDKLTIGNGSKKEDY